MADDTVDVLIIGAGASGAAIAWSLAETRMRIVCFEQGDWMQPRARRRGHAAKHALVEVAELLSTKGGGAALDSVDPTVRAKS